jgi:hypothetical protein
MEDLKQLVHKHATIIGAKFRDYLFENSTDWNYGKIYGKISAHQRDNLYSMFNYTCAKSNTKEEFKEVIIKSIYSTQANSDVMVSIISGVDNLVDILYDDYRIMMDAELQLRADFERRKAEFLPDYRSILIEYIKHVVSCEGVSFLGPHYSYIGELTDLEVDLLRDIDKQLILDEALPYSEYRCSSAEDSSES